MVNNFYINKIESFNGGGDMSRIKIWIKKKVKRWFKEKWLLWFLICVGELLLILYFNCDRVSNIVLKLVLDSNGNFNWASATPLVAILTIVFSWKNNNNSIKANIVSKSRIEWIQEVRKVSVEFLDACYNVTSLISVIKSGESQNIQPQNGAIAAAKVTLTEEKGRYSKNHNKDIIEEQAKVKKIGSLLSLYFGPDSSNNNQFIVCLIDIIVLSISENDKIFEQGKIRIEDTINDLKNIFRIYFKVEWKRSIGELDDYMVDYELNKDAKYKAIKEKYKDKLENIIK